MQAVVVVFLAAAFTVVFSCHIPNKYNQICNLQNTTKTQQLESSGEQQVSKSATWLTNTTNALLWIGCHECEHRVFSGFVWNTLTVTDLGISSECSDLILWFLQQFGSELTEGLELKTNEISINYVMMMMMTMTTTTVVVVVVMLIMIMIMMM